MAEKVEDDRFVDESTVSYEELLKMKATNKEMEKNRVPLAWRDQCAHRLIPLNKCRQQNFYLPWRCVELRHNFEKCEYYLHLARVWKMKQIEMEMEQEKAAAKEAARAAKKFAEKKERVADSESGDEQEKAAAKEAAKSAEKEERIADSEWGDEEAS